MATATPPTPGATTATPEAPQSRLAAFRARHAHALDVVFFALGFCFDALLLHRIDSVPLLIHQGSYLVLSAAFIGVDHRIRVTGIEPQGAWGRVLSVREWVIHFLLGTLLNAFVVFYFRATSILSVSAVFLALLLTVMVVNELPRFRAQGPVVRVALLSFAATSYFAYLLPLLAGRLRWYLFLAAVALGCVATWGFYVAARRWVRDPLWTAKKALLPGLAVQGVLLGLYLGDVLPPVPLSLRHLGVYYSVASEPGADGKRYRLESSKGAAWAFWRGRNDTLWLREGEKPHAFVAVFAPTGFADTLSFGWERNDAKRGWVALGAPTLHALGTGAANREHGFRTFAYASLTEAGRYRVVVRASDGRELGRETFFLERDDGTHTEERQVDWR